jgi:hypothetical protein
MTQERAGPPNPLPFSKKAVNGCRAALWGWGMGDGGMGGPGRRPPTAGTPPGPAGPHWPGGAPSAPSPASPSRPPFCAPHPGMLTRCRSPPKYRAYRRLRGRPKPRPAAGVGGGGVGGGSVGPAARHCIRAIPRLLPEHQAGAGVGCICGKKGGRGRGRAATNAF